MNRAVTVSRRYWVGALCLASLALLPGVAQAGLFDDSEARQAILDLRQRIDQGSEQSKARDAELSARLAEQVKVLRRSLLDLNSQISVMRSEFAKARGQDEQLARDITQLQLHQKDLAASMQERISTLEPQKISLDGKGFTVEPQEKRQYEQAVSILRKGNFSGAAAALVEFRRRYPSSGYNESALFWLGNAQYGMREYRDAMASFRALVSAAPAHARAPEALLSLANCLIELRNNKTAKRTLDELIAKYPESDAAQAGLERLATLD